MTPKQLKAARKKLRISARQLADALGMSGRWSDRTVRAWERGEYSIPSHVDVTIQQLLSERETHLAREKYWRTCVGEITVCPPGRNRDIAKRAAKGESFASIGRCYKISRERVRQIWFAVPESTRGYLTRYYHRDNRR